MGKYIEVSELKRYCEKCADVVKGIHETVMDKIGHGESDTSAIGAMAYFMQKENTYRNEIQNVISNFVDDYGLVDVAPVVHREWVETGFENSTGKIYQCANCEGCWNPSKTAVACGRQLEKPDYCQFCGAHMDGCNDKAVE